MGDARAPRIILFAIFSVPGMDLPEARDIVRAKSPACNRAEGALSMRAPENIVEISL